LTYLLKLPIDEVKLDQDLIIHVLTDPRAEGVETADIASWLRDWGCEVAQGIYYGPPITVAAMMELITLPAAHG